MIKIIFINLNIMVNKAFVIIHEQNNYIKKFLNVESGDKIYIEPKIEEKGERERGKPLTAILFGDASINSSLNLMQANYILDINNWRKE